MVNNREVSMAEETADVFSTNASNSSILRVKKQYFRNKVLSDISQGNIYLWGYLLFKTNTSSLDKPSSDSVHYCETSEVWDCSRLS